MKLAGAAGVAWVLWFVDDGDGAAGVGHHGLTGGSQQEPGESSAAAVTDDDQLCWLLTGGCGIAEQVRRGPSPQDPHLDGNVGHWRSIRFQRASAGEDTTRGIPAAQFDELVGNDVEGLDGLLRPRENDGALGACNEDGYESLCG